MFHATCEVVEAGIPADIDVDGDVALHDKRDAISAATYAAYDWPDRRDYFSRSGYEHVVVAWATAG